MRIPFNSRMNRVVPGIGVAVGLVMVVIHARHIRDEVDHCPGGFNIRIMFWYAILAVDGALGIVSTLKKSARCWDTVFKDVLFGLVFTSFINLYSLMQVEARSKELCLPRSILIIDWTITVTFASSIFLLMLCWGILNYFKQKRKNQVGAIKIKFDDVLMHILDPKFDVEKFIKENKEALADIDLTDREIAVMRDNFVHRYKRDPTKEKKDCPICLYPFENGQDVIEHPGCEHMFHLPCMEVWVGTHKKGCSCPYCRTSTREGMIQQLRENLHGSLEKDIIVNNSFIDQDA